MTEAFAHQVLVLLDEHGDPAALGGAVTRELCGSWEHDGPCAHPHHSEVREVGEVTELRTVLLADSEDDADDLRLRVDVALALGSLTGPDGRVTTWRVLGSAPVDLTADEADLATRLSDPDR